MDMMISNRLTKMAILLLLFTTAASARSVGTARVILPTIPKIPDGATSDTSAKNTGNSSSTTHDEPTTITTARIPTTKELDSKEPLLGSNSDCRGEGKEDYYNYSDENYKYYGADAERDDDEYSADWNPNSISSKIKNQEQTDMDLYFSEKDDDYAGSGEKGPNNDYDISYREYQDIYASDDYGTDYNFSDYQDRYIYMDNDIDIYPNYQNINSSIDDYYDIFKSYQNIHHDINDSQTDIFPTLNNNDYTYNGKYDKLIG